MLDKLKQEKERLLRCRRKLNKRLYKLNSSLPQGAINCYRVGESYKWYLVKTVDGKTVREYIAKADRKLAEHLAERDYTIAKLDDINHEIEAIDRYMRFHREEGKADRYVEKNAGYKELLCPLFQLENEDLKRWMNEDYPRRAFDPEIHTAQSICGMMHASKSEALIATQLTRYGIPFRYEPKMILSNGRIKYPDFLIKHPKTGELIIWEHFGMMEKWGYVENNMNKLKDYAHEGFLINRNVIVTMESNDIHLSYEEVNRIIEQWFM